MKKSTLFLFCLLFFSHVKISAFPPQNLKLPLETNLEIILGNRYYNQAKVLEGTADYKSAIFHFKNAARIYKEKELWESYGNVLITIGDNYINLANYDSARVYSTQLLNVSLQFNLKLFSATAYNNLGVCYNARNDYKKALSYHQKALNIRQKVRGRNHPDVATSYINLGVCYYEQGDYVKAVLYYQNALNILDALGPDNDLKATIYSSLGTCYLGKGEYKRAVLFMQKALNIRLTIQGENHPSIAISYNNLGLCYAYQGNFEKAVFYQKKALDIRLYVFGENNSTTATSYNNLGTCYHKQGDYEKAEIYYQKALKIQLRVLGLNHLKTATSYNNLGAYYDDQGDYIKAVSYYQKTLTVFLKVLGTNHPNTATAYNNLGGYHDDQGDHIKAVLHYQKALNIQLEILGENHLSTATSYNNLGLCYAHQNDYEKAVFFQEKALAIFSKLLMSDHPNIATSYNNLGAFHLAQTNYEEALFYHQKALKIHLNILGSNHLKTAASYSHLGAYYSSQNGHIKAALYHQKALEIRLKTAGLNHPHTLSSYHSMAELYANKGDFIRSLTYCQKALYSVAELFDSTDIYTNASLNKIIYKHEILKILHQKIRSAEKLYYQTSKFKDLQLSFESTQLAANLIDSMRNDAVSAKVKKDIAKNSLSAVYESGIRTAKQLYRITKKEEYLRSAFTMAERSKSFLLLQSLKDSEARSFAGIPDSLLEKERELKIEIVFYEKKLFEAENKKDSARVSMYQNYLFDDKTAFEKLINQLESDFPDYYRLKYADQTMSVKKIQEFLPKNTKLIEYFLGDSALYIFDISNTDYQLHEIKKPSGFDDSLNAFRQNLTADAFSSFINSDSKRKQAYFRHWVNQNHFLADLLLKPVLDNSSEKLIIIPDGALGYLPFEVLMTENQAGSNIDFSKLSYLINSHTVSYAYSAALLLESKDQRNNNHQLKPIAAFAPSYSNKISPPEDTLRTDLTALHLRAGFAPLKYNISEAKNAAISFDGDSFTGKNASKSVFQHTAKDYQILHLAMHATVDDQNPLYSALIFSDSQDTTTNTLDASELYNMKLNAQLAVLSACETGYGKPERGEGIMSLSRAFAYAGVPSLIMSLWKAEDKATANLMVGFYTHLKKNASIDVALRSAKLEYLQTDAHPYYSHPFLWAGFVSVGDTEPVRVNSSNLFLAWGIIGMLALIIGAVCFWGMRVKR